MIFAYEAYGSSMLKLLRRCLAELVNAAIVISSVLLCFAAMEAVTRTVSPRASLWRFPNYIVEYRTALSSGMASQFDERLGWVPRANHAGRNQYDGTTYTTSAEGLRLHNYDGPGTASKGSPILAVGDSFTAGADVDDNATWPAHLERTTGRRVLNGGVASYGLDQTVLRAEDLVSRLNPETLLVSFIADDVSRTELRVRSGVAKPYFRVKGGALLLENVPVPPPTRDAEHLDAVRRVLGFSLLVDVMMRRLDRLDYWYAGITMESRAHRDGEVVACGLMSRLAELSRTVAVRTIVVAQYSPDAWQSVAVQREQRRIVARVLDCAGLNGLESLDTFDDLDRVISREGTAPYFIGGHMRSAGNALVARIIAKHLATGHLPHDE